MTPSPDNLARFSRLAQRASARRAAVEAADRERVQELFAAEERRARKSAEFLAGPPGGCTVCYEWVFDLKIQPTPWGWRHQELINPEVRVVDCYNDGEPFEVEFCTHDCHGPEGLPCPLIGLAG